MATIVPHPNFDSTADADSLHEAMKGAGTDEAALVEVFVGRSNAQLQEVRRSYKSAFGTELIEKVESETSGDFKRACVALLKDRVQLRADILHSALSGLGTDIEQLVDVMAVMSSEEVEAVKEKFKSIHGKDLESEIRSDTTGNNEKTLCAILAAGRPTDAGVDEAKAVAEAKQLYEKGEGRAGTDNAFFRAVFCTRSWAQLKATLEAYNRQKDGHDIETALKSEFSGNTLKLYLAMARFATDSAAYFANLLKSCVAGVGTSEARLVNNLVLRAEVDLQRIKAKYFELFAEQLAVDIAGDTSGDFEKILLGIVKGNH